MDTERFEHPAWTTGLATLTSYGLVLLLVFALCFLLPFLLFLAL